ncbi:MAG: FAD:protein FMN transferase [Bacteroidetes bacterium]|jgi:thiamine biosynthesis lipoprotein|nr:FAD:protein FMN transferase [Bacteroidota bacterium]
MIKIIHLNWLICCLALISCNPVNKTEKVSFAGETQGTYYAISYYHSDKKNYQPQIDSLLKAFDQSVSLWVPNSLISRINSGDSTALPDDVFKYNFLLSKRIALDTDGYFDFTVSPLVEAWGFSFKEKIPLNQFQIDSLRSLVDFRNVKLENGRIVKTDPRIRFDFNAIAQGYSVDLIARFFDSRNIDQYIIDIGGEVFAKGRKPNGDNWRVGIERPEMNKNETRSVQQVVILEDKGLATSGSYRKYYEENGKRYSHAIDPKTGSPVVHNLLSVTVLANTAAEADAYATAFLVMGLEKSVELLKQMENLEAYFISWNSNGSFETTATQGFEKYFVE